MNESTSFNPSAGGPDAERRRQEWLDRLLACFQQGLGHELPNQLVAIQGLLRVLELEEQERLTADGRHYLGRLAALAQRSHELSRALAELARTARAVPSGETIALPDAVREAVAEIHLLSPDLSIEYDLPQDLPTLTVARPALRQVLVQLLRNAAQTGPDDRPPRARIGARRTEAGLTIRIEDDGRGITREQHQHLFEPFVPGALPRPGNELGLFLVRHVVESWGGSLHVRSEPGRGSTFTITLQQS